MMNKFIKIMLTLLVSSVFQNASAQNDTLKVGLNDQLIQVDAPSGGQKVTVLIEDSTFTYKVEISKLENRSLEEKMKELSKGVKPKKKAFSSSWFGSAEAGFNTVGFKTFYGTSDNQLTFNLNDSTTRNDLNYTRRSFSSEGDLWGAYIDFTIRERSRSAKRIENLYVKRKSHLRLDFNSVNGTLHFDDYIGSGLVVQDSFISGTSRKETISFTNLQLSQLLTYGYNFNEAKGISLEYGVNFGLQFTLSESNNDKSINIGPENAVNSFTIFNDYVANPFMRVQHHLAYNYGQYSLNAKITGLAKRFGNSEKNHVNAHIISLGLGYKF